MVSLATKPVKINKIRTVTQEPIVYDLSVVDNNNLFACSEISQKPILAHNCPYIELQYGIKIAGWILIYVSRDKSFRDYVSVGESYTDKSRKRLEKMIKQYDKHFGIAIKAKTYSNIIPLIEEKPCKCKNDYLENFHSEYEPCPLAKRDVCFKPEKLEAVMQKLAKNMKTKKVD